MEESERQALERAVYGPGARPTPEQVAALKEVGSQRQATASIPSKDVSRSEDYTPHSIEHPIASPVQARGWLEHWLSIPLWLRLTATTVAAVAVLAVGVGAGYVVSPRTDAVTGASPIPRDELPDGMAALADAFAESGAWADGSPQFLGVVGQASVWAGESASGRHCATTITAASDLAYEPTCSDDDVVQLAFTTESRSNVSLSFGSRITFSAESSPTLDLWPAPAEDRPR